MTDLEPKKRVLVVDDEKSITMALTIHLNATQKYEVHTENDPKAAIKVAREFDPDILLLDIVMPGMDGAEVLSMIRRIPGLSKVPALMVTAMVSNQEADEKGIVRNADFSMIPKPVRMEVLLEAIEEALGASEKP